ncbi:MAG: tRNA pseudouridine(55) synthase TruB [Alphaproteobacteria bacterium]|nr:tRNA pseudouridine(55) synthase TruB [Alphaproteobacteria bacterium]
MTGVNGAHGPRRGRPGHPIHGWLVVDKPLGMSSAQAVGLVKRALDAAKAGHAGTLDPLATGILPICLGEATKTMTFLQDADKDYRFSVRWGEARDTDDREGAVTETSDHRPDKAAIAAALPAFRGSIEQVPPVYSAIKVAGRRAYDLARAAAPVALAPRRVQVTRFDLIAAERDRAVFTVTCGKGTYVRSLARDLARALGTVGHVEELRRTRVGPFRERDAISLDRADASGHSAPLIAHLLPVQTALVDIPALAVTESDARRLRQGQAVSMGRSANRAAGASIDPRSPILAKSGERPVGLVRIDEGQLRPVRLFNL